MRNLRDDIISYYDLEQHIGKVVNSIIQFCRKKCRENLLLAKELQFDDNIIIDEGLVERFSIENDNLIIVTDRNEVIYIPMEHINDWKQYFDNFYESFFQDEIKYYDVDCGATAYQIADELRRGGNTICGITWRHDPEKPAGAATLYCDIAIDILDQQPTFIPDFGKPVKHVTTQKDDLHIGPDVLRLQIALEK